MSNKNSALAKEQAILDAATAEFNFKKLIIESYPDNVEMPWLISPTGYCAEASLTYKAGVNFAELLKALPAVPCLFISGDSVSVKPTAYVRETDRGWRREIFPVILVDSRGASSDSNARWWTMLAGRMIEVSAKGVSSSEVEACFAQEYERYTAAGYNYSTGAVRLWQVRMYRAEDFPALTPKEYWIQQGRDTADVALATETAACMVRAKAWIEQFVTTRGNPFTGGSQGKVSAHAHDVFRYLFRKETGLAGNINWISATDWNGGTAEGLQVAFTLDQAHIRVDCRYDPSLPAIDWDSLAQYR